MRKKSIRFQDNLNRNNIIEPGKSLYQTIKGQWHAMYFHNQHPIVIELACGKAAYTIGLGQQYPQKNIIGVDIKGDRLWVGSSKALAYNLQNVAFLRAQIQHLDQFFSSEEVEEIWITFPDPYPRLRDAKRRLTSPIFLKIYQQILKKNGIIHLKTDNSSLLSYTLSVLKIHQAQILFETNDLYQSSLLHHHHGIQTDYELKFLKKGLPIKYIQWTMKKEII